MSPVSGGRMATGAFAWPPGGPEVVPRSWPPRQSWLPGPGSGSEDLAQGTSVHAGSRSANIRYQTLCVALGAGNCTKHMTLRGR